MIEKMRFKNSAWEELVWELFRWWLFGQTLIIMCHGHKSNSNARTYNDLAINLRNNNIPYFRFDFSGHGESQGNLEDSNISKWTQDILDVIAQMKTHGFNQFILFGQSFGGICALAAALQTPEVVWLNLVNPWSGSQDYQDIINQAEWYEKPAMIIQASQDEQVSPAMTAKMAAVLPNSKFMEVDGADHGFTHERDYRRKLRYSLVFIFENI